MGDTISSTIPSCAGDDQKKPDTFCNGQNLTKSRKIALAVALILGNSILFFSFGSGVGAGLQIGKSFGVYNPTTATWIAAAYPLTQSAFVLISGRIGAVYGHKNVLLIGGAWWVIWSLANGFCTESLVAFSIARAMSGTGAALVMPNGMAIIAMTFPPGIGRNLCFGFFGLGAPVGGVSGILIIGLMIEFLHWRWFFFLLTMIGVILYSSLWFVLPQESPVDTGGNVDWAGASLGIGALILFNFVWNQAPAIGWQTPYEIALLVLSLILFGAFGFWEHKVAKHPIMPLNIWTAPSFLPMIIVALFSVMAYGITLWYMVAWQQIVRHWSVLHFAVGMIPHAVFGGLTAPFAAWLIPRVSAQWIMAFGAFTMLLSSILLAIMPAQQTYWAMVFPATILMSLSPDLIFCAASIIAANSVKRHEQGVAGSLVSLLQLYGASIGLGFAGTVEDSTNHHGSETLDGYKGALYLAIGLGAAALLIDILFVRVPKDKRDGWAEETGI